MHDRELLMRSFKNYDKTPFYEFENGKYVTRTRFMDSRLEDFRFKNFEK